MQPPIPHFKIRSRDPANKHWRCIEVEGEVIHQIGNLEEFYKSFGYTEEMAKAGKLADEFIWEEFTKNAEAICTACYQLHMIKYLLKHSVAFLHKYGERYNEWIAAHSVARAENEKLCVGCKAKPLAGNIE